MEALGLIENKSFLSSIVAADSALKAADVTLINAEIIKAGYVTVQLLGDVAAVQAAVDAGREAVEPFGTLVSTHVIPRMHMETHRIIEKLLDYQTDVTESDLLPEPPETKKLEEPEGLSPVVVSDPEQLEEADHETNEIQDPESDRLKTEESQTEAESDQVAEGETQPELASNKKETAEMLYREDLEKMTVAKLRQLVRDRNAMQDGTKNIKYARKRELISSLLDDD